MTRQHSKSAPKKPKLVRDSFTIPKAEFAAVDALKVRALGLGVAVKKSELLRAGLKLLVSVSDSGYLDALAAIPTLKTGRPRADVAKPTPVKKAAAPLAKKPATKAAPRKRPQAAAKRPTKTAPVSAKVQTQPAAKAPAKRPAAKAPAGKAAAKRPVATKLPASAPTPTP